MTGERPPAGNGKPLVLTMGEPAGIGGEITLKAWLSASRGRVRLWPSMTRTVCGDWRRHLGLPVPVRAVDAVEEAPARASPARCPLLDRPLPAPAFPGRLNPANAPAVIAAIEDGGGLGESAGPPARWSPTPSTRRRCTTPGSRFPGIRNFSPRSLGTATPVMMLAGPTLRVVPVTIHVSFRAAIATLNTELIIRTATITDAALRRDFGIERPRLAIAGLEPARGRARRTGIRGGRIDRAGGRRAPRATAIDAFGPLPPDTLFSPRSRRTFDAAICMYHDQALIPLKALDFDNGVNVTLGLPFVRTSPDHGTALDIAGTGRADESSLMASLELAAAMARAPSRIGPRVTTVRPPLPPLRDVIARHNLATRRSLGQHFLLDLNLTDRIARIAGDLTGVSVIEIGPGPGGLTRSLLEAGAPLVVAVEKDQRCIAAIGELADAFPGRLHVVEADALEVDVRTLAPAPRKIVANLPFNVGTPLLLAMAARRTRISPS